MSERFLGATKFQFTAFLVILALLVVGVEAYTIRQNTDIAAQGAQAHTALCVFKHDLATRADSSKTFLALSHAARVAKYGHALGDIPPATIRQSLRSQEATIASLHALNCN